MKKVVKKKIIKTKGAKTPSKPSDDVEMPMAKMDDVNDVAEDYQVFDMSNIAAPVIEFELPNLTERKIEVTSEEDVVPENKTLEKKKAAKPRSSKKAKSSGNKEPLTAEKLNNEFVKLRATIVKSKNQLMSKLVRQKKKLEGAKKKTAETGRKVARLTEEIIGLKSFDKDAVAKFAAINTKTLNELKIDAKTPVSDRLMYKLTCQEVVIKEVENIKEKYTEWNKTAAFFMQRLGLQYSNKEKKEDKKNDDDDVDEDGLEVAGEIADELVDEDEKEDEDSSEEGVDGEYNESDVEMVDSDEEAGNEAAKNRRALLLGLIGAREDKSRPALKPKKRKIEDEEDEDDTQNKAKKTTNGKTESKKVLKKTIDPKQGNKTAASQIKKPTNPKTVEEKVPEDEESAQKTLVMKVDLSKGGKIETSKAKAPVKKIEAVTKKEEAEEEDDDDESAAFFLPNSGAQSAKTVKKVAPKKEKDTKIKTPVPTVEVSKKKGSSKNNTVTGEDHPSWVASQQKKKMASAKPCGKKIVFGDD
uniref:SRF-dependent transcription regulation-associated protein n=1 Tax=Caenorhabditis japonica TaxID=281687 RepID=A0A8R1DPL7_CAEJA